MYTMKMHIFSHISFVQNICTPKDILDTKTRLSEGKRTTFILVLEPFEPFAGSIKNGVERIHNSIRIFRCPRGNHESWTRWTFRWFLFFCWRHRPSFQPHQGTSYQARRSVISLINYMTYDI